MPTPPPKNRITGMGSALVDLFADISDAQLAELGSPKASSTLVSAQRTKELAAFATIHTRLPGGSAANTIAGIAALGMPTGFIGKIGNDEMGRFFADAFTKLNVRLSHTHAATKCTANWTLRCAGYTRWRAHHAHGARRGSHPCRR